jgi:hypothetical protein
MSRLQPWGHWHWRSWGRRRFWGLWDHRREALRIHCLE